MKTIRDFDLSDKKVLIRCDFNVPIKEGKIIDDTRIVASLETIRYALEKGAKVILFSHLGRVKDKADLAKNDLKPVAVRLSELLNQDVVFVPVTRGKKLEDAIRTMKQGEVILVQNTRYEDLDGKKESGNNEELGMYWAHLGDLFINDAFGTAHRAHASNVGISRHLPSGIGFLIEKELTKLDLVKHPDHPFTVILGGSKVSDKIGIISSLVKQADHILIGGGMAFTFLKEEGYEIGSSLFDQDSLSFCHEMLQEYPSKIILPIDVVVSSSIEEEESAKEVSINEIPSDQIGLDIGPETVQLFYRYMAESKTVLWNGPLGVYEVNRFSRGTDEVLKQLVNLPVKSVLAGGDILAAATKLGVKDQVTHAATGGGATLEYLEGKTLPGIQAIEDQM